MKSFLACLVLFTSLPVQPVQQNIGGGISGRVMTPDGEPPGDLMVTALRRSVDSDGAVTTQMGQSARPNEAGMFEFSRLPPGEYVVVARPQTAALTARRLSDGRIALAPTFFPGTTDLRSAKPLTVTAGETVTGIEFAIGSAVAHDIRGVVVDAAGAPLARTQLYLTWNRRNAGAGPMRVITAFSASDGTFAISGVVSGTYTLNLTTTVSPPTGDVVSTAPDGTPVSAAPGGPRTSLVVTVGDADVVGLRIALPARR